MPHTRWMLLSLFLLIPGKSYSQYFGRNKVNYEDFSFKILQSKHFRVYYYEKETNAAGNALRMLEQWHAGMKEVFGTELGPDQPIILYANHADFQQTNVTGGIIPQGTGGFTEGLKNRIVIPFSGINRNDKHVLGHELVHAFQYNHMKKNKQMRQSGANRVPLWIIEGMAEYLSIGRKDPLTAMWMRDAVMNDNLPAFSDLARSSEYFPYRWGHAAWVYIAGRWGDEIVLPLFSAVLKNGWEKGCEETLGVSSDSLSVMWQMALEETFKAPVETRRAWQKENLQEIIIGYGGMNMAPSLSPDGDYIAFLSRKDLFTIDLFLGDAHTGDVIKKLVSSNTDQHFDALRFMNSAGSWSPDGGKFAFVVFNEGDNAIALLDVRSREVVQTIRFDAVDQIAHLAWSPDGDRLLFSGSSGGISDLYIYHLRDGKTIPVTQDTYSEIQPAWSPDGERIAYATDRGPGTDPDRHIFGAMNIAITTLKTEKTEILYISESAKHINPHFSADGQSLFMISDPDGISNIYRYEIETDQLYKLTDLVTGASGLTELSPALSVAGKENRIAFTVYENGDYNIYALKQGTTHGSPYQHAGAYSKMVSLPITARSDQGIVEQYLSDETAVPAPDKQPETMNYNPSLKLVHIGQTGIGVVADRYGASIGGGVSMFFSDMLGNHLLGTQLQSNGSVKDIGGSILYQNRKQRFNWGGIIAHIPYQSARLYRGTDTVTVDEENYIAQRYELERQRIYIDRLSLETAFPLSINRRFEASAGYTRYSYDYEREYYTSLGGLGIDQGTEELDSPPGLNLFQTSLAYVGDYSFSGFTSAVRGSRFRFEAEPTFGTLDFLTILADYRHYFFMNPVTIAFRGMHVGRYWQDAENSRMSPLYIGYHTYVRGYSLGSFKVSDCRTTADGGCSIYDQLTGSRIAIFNAEVRIPFFGTDEFGLITFPFLPTELVAFFDGGAAWNENDLPELVFDTAPVERVPLFSTGGAARINVMGFLIVQFYYAHAFQRLNDKGQFGFVIAPGW